MSQRLILYGEFSTDGSCVYLGGMTLADVLTASVPNRESLEYEGKHIFTDAHIKVDVTWPEPDRSHER